MAISKKDRLKVYEKYDGHCAYCGVKLKEKGWHLDHIEPLHRKNNPELSGADDISNANPSCPRCNNWKHNFSIEQFRREISKQVERLRRDRSAFRIAEDFGLVKQSMVTFNEFGVKKRVQNPVIFYFEKQSKITTIRPQL